MCGIAEPLKIAACNRGAGPGATSPLPSWSTASPRAQRRAAASQEHDHEHEHDLRTLTVTTHILGISLCVRWPVALEREVNLVHFSMRTWRAFPPMATASVAGSDRGRSAGIKCHKWPKGSLEPRQQPRGNKANDPEANLSNPRRENSDAPKFAGGSPTTLDP